MWASFKTPTIDAGGGRGLQKWMEFLGNDGVSSGGAPKKPPKGHKLKTCKARDIYKSYGDPRRAPKATSSFALKKPQTGPKAVLLSGTDPTKEYPIRTSCLEKVPLFKSYVDSHRDQKTVDLNHLQDLDRDICAHVVHAIDPKAVEKAALLHLKEEQQTKLCAVKKGLGLPS